MARNISLLHGYKTFQLIILSIQLVKHSIKVSNERVITIVRSRCLLVISSFHDSLIARFKQ